MYLHRCLSQTLSDTDGLSLCPQVPKQMLFVNKLPSHISSIYKYSDLVFLKWWGPGQVKHANLLLRGSLSRYGFYVGSDTEPIATETSHFKRTLSTNVVVNSVLG